jgi:hypothetical protein
MQVTYCTQFILHTRTMQYYILHLNQKGYYGAQRTSFRRCHAEYETMFDMLKPLLVISPVILKRLNNTTVSLG